MEICLYLKTKTINKVTINKLTYPQQFYQRLNRRFIDLAWLRHEMNGLVLLGL